MVITLNCEREREKFVNDKGRFINVDRERGREGEIEIDTFLFNIYFLLNSWVWGAEFNLHNIANEFKDFTWITWHDTDENILY